MENEPDIDTKDILSFSWRALKEARSELLLCLLGQLTKSYSSLLQFIVLKSPLVIELESESPEIGLNHEGLERLARLAFTQLAELRHRGAFSAVAHAYAACCLRCHQSGQFDILEVLYNVSQLLHYLNLKCLLVAGHISLYQTSRIEGHKKVCWNSIHCCRHTISGSRRLTIQSSNG